jgi:hypothetical protein
MSLGFIFLIVREYIYIYNTSTIKIIIFRYLFLLLANYFYFSEHGRLKKNEKSSLDVVVHACSILATWEAEGGVL